MSPSIGSAARRGVPGPPSDRVKARLLRLYEALRGRFGPQGWWLAARRWRSAGPWRSSTGASAACSCVTG
jgi:hypothetical protein